MPTGRRAVIMGAQALALPSPIGGNAVKSLRTWISLAVVAAVALPALALAAKPSAKAAPRLAHMVFFKLKDGECRLSRGVRGLVPEVPDRPPRHALDLDRRDRART